MAMTIEILTKRIETLEKQFELALNNTKLSDVKEKKSKAGKKAKDDSSDDEKPKKKRTSGYILFSNANRDDMKTKLTIDDEKPKNTEVMKGLAAMWKDLTDEEKSEWNTKASQIQNDNSMTIQ